MIVRLDLESNPPAFADVDHPGIFLPRLDQDLAHGILVLLFSRKESQKLTGILVSAMFRPHDRKNPQFGQVRFAPENLEHVFILLRKQAMLGNQFGRDLDIQARIGIRRESDRGLIGHDAESSIGLFFRMGSRKDSRTGNPS